MNSSSELQPNEILGNEQAEHTMKFEYCGGWGYRRHVVAAIEKIEEKFPGLFKYTIYRDKKTTSRLECTVYPNSKSDQGNDGIVVHSKQESKKYISSDYETFLALIGDAIGMKEWWKSRMKFITFK